MTHRIKVLIVEDSPLAAKLLAFILHADPQIEVIGLPVKLHNILRNKCPEMCPFSTNFRNGKTA